MSDMTWDYDICLSCDNHSRDGDKYCSQACRLVDVERGGRLSEPSTPSLFAVDKPSTHAWHLGSLSDSNSSSRRVHPVEARFDSPPASPRSYASSHQHSYAQTTSTFASAVAALQLQPTGHGLSTSPSRSSLSSVSSNGASLALPGLSLSQHMKDQLRGYSGAFDRTRDWKRRRTMG